MIERAVFEARGPEATFAVPAASKQAEAVLIAERNMKGSGWFPTLVRIAADLNVGVEADA